MSKPTHTIEQEEIMAYLDGELSADRSQLLSGHIAECSECASLVHELRELSLQLSSWKVENISEDLTARVNAVAASRTATTLHSKSSSATRRLSLAIKFALASAGAVLLMAIFVPNLMRSRMAANEASAVGSLRTINIAAGTYLSSYGHFPPSLKSLGSFGSASPTAEAAGLIDDVLARGEKSGYLFTYSLQPSSANGKDGYRANADALRPGSTGFRHFSTDQTGIIYANGAPLDGSSPSNGIYAAKTLPASVASPMIARTADLKVVVANLDQARHSMDTILAEHKGYVAQLSASAEGGASPSLVTSLRVPADQLDQTVAALKQLGRVAQEAQAGEEVTQQHVDLVARLQNSRNTEARLNEVVRQHQGPIKEILEVEKESARVRGEIEQMEAEQKNLEHRVSFGTIELRLFQEYRAELTGPAPSILAQLRNASVDGFRSAFQSLLAILLFLAEALPTLTLWLLLLLGPAWLLWRRYRQSLSAI